MADIDTFSLASSVLAGGQYDPESRELVLQFQNGREYSYTNIDAELVERLKSAVSAGHFWRDNLKGKG